MRTAWQSFQHMVRAMRKVFPESKTMMTNRDFDLCAIGDVPLIFMPPADNDNAVGSETERCK